MTAPDTRRWLTNKEMCEILGVSRPTLRQLVASGDVRASRLTTVRGSHYRFHPDEPARYFAATQQRAAS